MIGKLLFQRILLFKLCLQVFWDSGKYQSVLELFDNVWYAPQEVYKMIAKQPMDIRIRLSRLIWKQKLPFKS